MYSPLLQALIHSEIPPQSVNINHLMEMAERYQNPQSSEYKLVELALNIVIGHYLEKVNELL